jgi:hypothetical protein
MLFLHLCCRFGQGIIDVDFSFFTFTSKLVFAYGYRLILTVAQLRVFASTDIRFNFSKSKRDSSMPKFEESADFVNFTLGD